MNGGAGSRGGHVIGFTKDSHKAIYATARAHDKRYASFTPAEHAEAAAAHAKQAKKHEAAARRSAAAAIEPKQADAREHHMAQRAAHAEAYARHRYRATEHGNAAAVSRKSAGVGSRGGHVVHFTSSGLPVYAATHEAYIGVHAAFAQHHDMTTTEHQAARALTMAQPAFGKLDHLEAAGAHAEEAARLPRHSPLRLAAHQAAQAHAAASFGGYRARSPSAKSAFQSGLGVLPVQSAKNHLHRHIHKAAGIGSRGGHVIGYTRSQKPIYSMGVHRHGVGKDVLGHPAIESGLAHMLTSTAEAGLHNGHVEHRDEIQAMHDEYFSDHSAADHMDASLAHKEAAAEAMDNHDRPTARLHQMVRYYHKATAHFLHLKEEGR